MKLFNRKPSRPKPDAYVMSLWDNIEVGKTYIIQNEKFEKFSVKIINLTNDKRAVLIDTVSRKTYQSDSGSQLWLTAKAFINSLIDEVSE